MKGGLPRLIARIPATVQAKLLVAFLTIVVLLIVIGAVGLQSLQQTNRRSDDMLDAHRKIMLYRQLQHDATAQLGGIASALLVPDEQNLDRTLRQLNQFGYDVDRLQLVAQDEVELLRRVREDYGSFLNIVTRVVELSRAGRIAEGRELQLSQASPLAERIDRLMNELVNRVEVNILETVDSSHREYESSRKTFIAIAAVSIALAIALGYFLSWSLIGPLEQIDARLKQIASGDFSQRVDIPNRDELGTLAANLNRMSEELGRLYRQIETVSRHKSDFLANMSHELRTPLNAIMGFSEALLERLFGELNDKQADYLKEIHRSGHHLLSLINDILDLSKIEAGHMELHCADFDVGAALDNAIILVRERAQRHGIALALEVAPDLGEIHGDERKFKQILLNLLSNAVKFTADGGSVRVMARRGEQTIEVAVADTGIGIALADQEAVFEEFRQVGQSYTNKQQGTGLGLALTKRFVELHGGRLWLESAPGQGSTFYFTLPLCAP